MNISASLSGEKSGQAEVALAGRYCQFLIGICDLEMKERRTMQPQALGGIAYHV